MKNRGFSVGHYLAKLRDHGDPRPGNPSFVTVLVVDVERPADCFSDFPLLPAHNHREANLEIEPADLRGWHYRYFPILEHDEKATVRLLDRCSHEICVIRLPISKHGVADRSRLRHRRYTDAEKTNKDGDTSNHDILRWRWRNGNCCP